MADATPQPEHGALVFHCGHLGSATHHFYQVDNGPLRLKRPDGSMAEAGWIAICPRCLEKNPDPARSIRGESYWTGDEPLDLTKPS